MSDKSLQDKAVKIKGNDYVMVKDRITFFNNSYSNGKIVTDVVSDNGKEIVFKAVVIPDAKNPERVFCGHASGVRGGKGVDSTSAVENAETSAVGRALAMMGIGVIDSVASVDEIKIAEKREYKEVEPEENPNKMSIAQKRLIVDMLRERGVKDVAMAAKIRGYGYSVKDMTKTQAIELIDKIKAEEKVEVGENTEAEEKAVDEIFDSISE